MSGTFEQAVKQFVIEDPRYPAEAYIFLKAAFDATMTGNTHVSGAELAENFAAFALEQFGPMAKFTLEKWGIFSTSDIGNLVFNLIEMGILYKNEGDKRSDFDDVFNLTERLTSRFAP